MKRPLIIFALILSSFTASAFAQDANTNAQPASRQTAEQAPPPKSSAPAATPQPAQSTAPPARERRAAPPPQSDPAVKAVNAAFDALVDAIRRADPDAAMRVYWNSPHLHIFNYNGTTTTTWDQVRANRASSYPKTGGVKLDVRDVRVQMLGRDAALVTCVWSQSQTFDGKPESSTGRLSLVFRRAGTDWKIVHTHTSPDNPDPSRLLPSERVTTNNSTTTAAPSDTPATPPPAKP